jgi:hypothetical protein
MIICKWKTVRFIAIAGIVAGYIWLSWMVPTLGFFRIAASEPPVTEDGVSIVYFKDGKSNKAYSLSRVTLGWPVVKEAWPLVLFGLVIGYPLGELIRQQFAVEQLSEATLKKKRALSLEALAKEHKAERMLQEAREITAELPQLREEVKQARRRIYNMNLSAGEQERNYEAMERKVESLERELFKARAKMRRLATKKISPGKSVGETPWPQ